MSEPEAPRSLWHAYVTPGPASRVALEALARHYQGLVRSIAFNLKLTLPSYISDHDLLSYGQFGLLRAIERYDPEQGPFTRFASAYVRGAIVDELRSQDWAPRGLRREQRLMRQATTRLRDSDAEPSLQQIADQLGWQAAKVASLQRQVENSHHQTIEGAELEDGVSFETDDGPESQVNADLMCLLFCETFDSFDLVTQYVLSRIYFLHETLTSVAATTSLPLATVRKVHADAVIACFKRVAGSVA